MNRHTLTVTATSKRRIGNLMDMVLVRADFAETPYPGRGSQKWNVAAIAPVLDLLDKHKAISLSYTPEEALAIRKNLAALASNTDQTPALTGADRPRMKM